MKSYFYTYTFKPQANISCLLRSTSFSTCLVEDVNNMLKKHWSILYLRPVLLNEQTLKVLPSKPPVNRSLSLLLLLLSPQFKPAHASLRRTATDSHIRGSHSLWPPCCSSNWPYFTLDSGSLSLTYPLPRMLSPQMSHDSFSCFLLFSAQMSFNGESFPACDIPSHPHFLIPTYLIHSAHCHLTGDEQEPPKHTISRSCFFANIAERLIFPKHSLTKLFAHCRAVEKYNLLIDKLSLWDVKSAL